MRPSSCSTTASAAQEFSAIERAARKAEIANVLFGPGRPWAPVRSPKRRSGIDREIVVWALLRSDKRDCMTSAERALYEADRERLDAAVREAAAGDFEVLDTGEIVWGPRS
jgi:hypothetical protein